jgi:valyl-tRNA synthetase
MDTFQYGEAGRQIYEFFWSEFCDWYLEISKIAMYRGDAAAKARTRATLIKVVDESLRLLHPFIPFVTEETWGYLKEAVGGEAWPAALMTAPWPTPQARDEAAEADMTLVMDIIRAIRNARAEYNVQPGQGIPAAISAGDKEALIRDQADTICTLARIDPARLTIAAHLDAPSQALTLVTGAVSTYLPLVGLIDLTAERARLGKELADTEAQIARSEQLLAGPFAERAPANVVQREREKQADLRTRADRLRERLADLA